MKLLDELGLLLGRERIELRGPTGKQRVGGTGQKWEGVQKLVLMWRKGGSPKIPHG